METGNPVFAWSNQLKRLWVCFSKVWNPRGNVKNLDYNLQPSGLNVSWILKLTQPLRSIFDISKAFFSKLHRFSWNHSTISQTHFQSTKFYAPHVPYSSSLGTFGLVVKVLICLTNQLKLVSCRNTSFLQWLWRVRRYKTIQIDYCLKQSGQAWIYKKCSEIRILLNQRTFRIRKNFPFCWIVFRISKRNWFVTKPK